MPRDKLLNALKLSITEAWQLADRFENEEPAMLRTRMLRAETWTAQTDSLADKAEKVTPTESSEVRENAAYYRTPSGSVGA